MSSDRQQERWSPYEETSTITGGIVYTFLDQETLDQVNEEPRKPIGFRS